MFYSEAIVDGRKKKYKQVEKRASVHNRKAFHGAMYGSLKAVSNKYTFGSAGVAIQSEISSSELDRKFLDLRKRLSSNRYKKVTARILRDAGFKFTKLQDRTLWTFNDYNGRYFQFHWVKLVGSERNFEVMANFMSRQANYDRCRKFTLAKTKGLHKFEVQLSCGCCDAEVWFTSEDAIAKAFELAGLSSSADIRDDLGNLVTGVDTFYGYRRVEEERRGLGYLINKAGITF